MFRAFEAVLDRRWPILTESRFDEKGVLTPQEFIAAGDFLCARFPTWRWAGGERSLRKAYLPPDKQYLVQCNVTSRFREENGDKWLILRGKEDKEESTVEGKEDFEGNRIRHNKECKDMEQEDDFDVVSVTESVTAMYGGDERGGEMGQVESVTCDEEAMHKSGGGRTEVPTIIDGSEIELQQQLNKVKEEEDEEDEEKEDDEDDEEDIGSLAMKYHDQAELQRLGSFAPFSFVCCNSLVCPVLALCVYVAINLISFFFLLG
jgi:ubiquitin-like-conjugating enzyme ATG3